MGVSAVFFDPEIQARANKGEWPAGRVPPWLTTGIFEFQYDSIQYRINLGETVTMPTEVARHAVRRGSFAANHLTGEPISAIRIVQTYETGVIDPYRCPAQDCSAKFDDYAELAKHLLESHAVPAAGRKGLGELQQKVGKTSTRTPLNEAPGSAHSVPERA